MRLYIKSLFFVLFLAGISSTGKAQSFAAPKYGQNDTIVSQTIFYDNEWIPYSQMEMVYISNVSPEKLAKILQEYNRLRNAVYVTYPYARTAGLVINDVNFHLKGVDSKKQRK